MHGVGEHLVDMFFSSEEIESLIRWVRVFDVSVLSIDCSAMRADWMVNVDRSLPKDLGASLQLDTCVRMFLVERKTVFLEWLH